jgi:hypothetical protein
MIAIAMLEREQKLDEAATSGRLVGIGRRAD